MLAGTTLLSLSELHTFASDLKKSSIRMPVLFVGHGSPMNAIESNEFSQAWQQLGKDLPLPKAIICVSAHWLTNGTYITAMDKPKTIHDFGGFPKALFDAQYPAPGSNAIAEEMKSLIHFTDAHLDHEWGLDHGTWSVLLQMYPQANIPVIQLSIDYNKPASYHYQLASELRSLREKGIMIIGSGNMVHNLGIIDWNGNPDKGYDWAVEMNELFKAKILAHEDLALQNYMTLNKASKLAIPSPDHYYPLIYTLGLKDQKDQIKFFNDKAVMGSITMTSVIYS